MFRPTHTAIPTSQDTDACVHVPQCLRFDLEQRASSCNRIAIGASPKAKEDRTILGREPVEQQASYLIPHPARGIMKCACNNSQRRYDNKKKIGAPSVPFFEIISLTAHKESLFPACRDLRETQSYRIFSANIRLKMYQKSRLANTTAKINLFKPKIIPFIKRPHQIGNGSRKGKKRSA